MNLKRVCQALLNKTIFPKLLCLHQETCINSLPAPINNTYYGVEMKPSVSVYELFGNLWAITSTAAIFDYDRAMTENISGGGGYSSSWVVTGTFCPYGPPCLHHSFVLMAECGAAALLRGPLLTWSVTRTGGCCSQYSRHFSVQSSDLRLSTLSHGGFRFELAASQHLHPGHSAAHCRPLISSEMLESKEKTIQRLDDNAAAWLLGLIRHCVIPGSGPVRVTGSHSIYINLLWQL